MRRPGDLTVATRAHPGKRALFADSSRDRTKVSRPSRIGPSAGWFVQCPLCAQREHPLRRSQSASFEHAGPFTRDGTALCRGTSARAGSGSRAGSRAAAAARLFGGQDGTSAHACLSAQLLS